NCAAAMQIALEIRRSSVIRACEAPTFHFLRPPSSRRHVNEAEGSPWSEELELDEFDRLARLFGVIAVRAGEVILKARADTCRPDYKADGSPVTAADLAADEAIRACLERNLPDLPVVTEETCATAPRV